MLNRIPEQDYLILDNASDAKYEFIDGQIYTVSGCTPNHSRIAYNLNGLIYSQIRNRQCGGYANSLRLKLDDHYLYPDFTVVCGEAKFDEDYPNNLLNPKMVVEVVSDSSEVRDHFIKLNVYQTIVSLKIYMIIEQSEPKVTLHTRHDDGWLTRKFEGLGAVVPLDALSAQLNLSELYETIDFEDAS